MVLGVIYMHHYVAVTIIRFRSILGFGISTIWPNQTLTGHMGGNTNGDMQEMAEGSKVIEIRMGLEDEIKSTIQLSYNYYFFWVVVP